MKQTIETKYKKFEDNGKGDCIHCNERRYDCCCAEKTAESLGYHYDFIPTNKTLVTPPTPKGLVGIDLLAFLAKNPTSKESSIGVWRRGKTWFKNANDLVDYHNQIQKAETDSIMKYLSVVLRKA